MAITRPVVFVSHAATDRPIAQLLKSEIDRVFANGVEVFASSVPGTIAPGEDWLERIRSNLERAQAVVVLITPISINRPWIWFEIGASWSRTSDSRGRIYPLRAPEIAPSDLPEPLNRLQALSLGKAADVKLFFQALCDQFGFGNMKGFRGGSISQRLPKYADLPVQQIDLELGTVYQGPYQGYSDEELGAVIEEDLARTHSNVLFIGPTSRINRSNIFSRKLIHYRQMDDQLKLPPGTCKRMLKSVAAEWNLQPTDEWENSIRFLYLSR